MILGDLDLPQSITDESQEQMCSSDHCDCCIDVEWALLSKIPDQTEDDSQGYVAV